VDPGNRRREEGPEKGVDVAYIMLGCSDVHGRRDSKTDTHNV
jgi:hypothetical protein